MVLNANEKIAKGEFKVDDLLSFEPTNIHTKKYIEAKDIKNYQINRIRYLEWDTERSPSKIRRKTFPELYERPKLMIGSLTGGIYDNEGLYTHHGIINFVRFCDLKGVENKSIQGSIAKNNSSDRNELEKISENFDLKYILAILNSKYANKYLNNNRRHRLENYFYPDDFRNLPIPEISVKRQQPFIEKADIMLSKNKEIHELKTDFLNFLKSELTPQKITKKLENWNELDWEQLKEELTKCKAKELSLKDRKQWQDYFTEQRQKADEIKSVIDNTDKEIDQMVYELYGLTQEEIEIVEKTA